ncbi:Kinesin light chain [Ilyonectria robusta]
MSLPSCFSIKPMARMLDSSPRTTRRGFQKFLTIVPTDIYAFPPPLAASVHTDLLRPEFNKHRVVPRKPTHDCPLEKEIDILTPLRGAIYVPDGAIISSQGSSALNKSGDLRGYSLVSATVKGDVCEMHTLVQFCNCVWLSVVDNTDRWK